MSRFTVGERRGLLLIIAIMLCIILYLLVSKRLTRGDATIFGDDPLISITTFGDSAALDNDDQRTDGKKRKKSSRSKSSSSGSSKKTSTPPPVRNPLDEPVN